jgi:hypothetical protein
MAALFWAVFDEGGELVTSVVSRRMCGPERGGRHCQISSVTKPQLSYDLLQW